MPGTCALTSMPGQFPAAPTRSDHVDFTLTSLWHFSGISLRRCFSRRQQNFAATLQAVCCEQKPDDEVVQCMQGLLERLAVDPSGPNWLMTGSSRGHLTLWDMRFQLAVNSTQLAQVHSTPFCLVHKRYVTGTITMSAQAPPEGAVLPWVLWALLLLLRN